MENQLIGNAPASAGGMETCTPSIEEIRAVWDDDSTAIEVVFDRAIAFQVAQGTSLEDGPCAEIKDLWDEWGDGPFVGPFDEHWLAAKNRFEGKKPQLVEEVFSDVQAQKAWKDAVVLGDLDSPEAEAVLHSPITIMAGQHSRVPGPKWVLNEGTVGELIHHHLACHPVRDQKDGKAFVYARGEKAARKTSSEETTQYACRIQNKIEAVTALCIDVDGTDKARRVAERILELGFFGVVYTTHSHAEKKTVSGDRFRVVMFLDKPVQFSTDDAELRRNQVADWRARYAGVCELLGLDEIDASGLNLHQMMYTPRRPTADSEFEHYIVAGRALIVDELPKGDVSNFRKSGPAHGTGDALCEKDYGLDRPTLSDGFDLSEWYHDVGKHLLINDVLDVVGWDVRDETSSGWVNVQCPNSAQRSDPDDDTAGVIETDEGFALHCFHDHCSALNTLDFVALIEKAIKAGEIALPDEYESLSWLLCDASFYPDEIDGEPVDLDPRDFGVEEQIEIPWLKNEPQVKRAYKAVVENSRSGDAHFAALYAGVEKGGNKTKAVAQLDELMSASSLHNGNDRTRLKKLGSTMLKEERAAWAAKQKEKQNEQAKAALDSSDLAHPSMDPADPLGDDLDAAMATLSNRYAVVDLNGLFRVVRKPDLHSLSSDTDSTIKVYRKQDFVDLHLDRLVQVGDEIINPAAQFINLEQRKSGLVFAPPPVKTGPNDLNMYQGRILKPTQGDWSTLEAFIRDIVCDGDEDKFAWLILWMAHLVQFPGEKPGTAVVATGAGGVGKGSFGEILMNMTKPHCKQLENESHVIGQFAGEHLSKCVLVVVNEAVFGASKRVSSTLKSHVDSATIQVEAKGMNLTTVPSYMRFYFDSNDAVPVLIEKNGSERRYFVIRFRDAKKQDLTYFKELREAMNGDEMAALLGYLEQYDPASAGLSWDAVRTAPPTPERDVMGWHSMPPAMRLLKQVLDDGEVVLVVEGVHETFEVGANGSLRVPRAEFRKHIESAGDKRRAGETDLNELFLALHPGAEIGSGRGRVGSWVNKHWLEFPAQVIVGSEMGG